MFKSNYSILTTTIFLTIQNEILNLSYLKNKKGILKIEQIHIIKFGIILISKNKNEINLKSYLSLNLIPNETKKIIFFKILSSLNECHKHRIAHRDIKLENVIIDSQLNITIIDFGSSVYLPNKKYVLTNNLIGTWLYTPPEIFLHTVYDRKIICFIILYILILVLRF